MVMVRVRVRVMVRVKVRVRVIVNIDASCNSIVSNCALHSGQLVWVSSQLSIQGIWKAWSQPSIRNRSPTCRD